MIPRAHISLLFCSLLLCALAVGGCKKSASSSEAAPKSAESPPAQTVAQPTPDLPSAHVYALLHDEQCAATTITDPDSNHTVEMPFAVVSGMERYDLRLASEPALPPLNAPFTLRVTITERAEEQPTLAQEGVSLDVSAWMTDHLHGLVVRPSIARTAPGVYTVSNLLLHMEGKWQMYFDITEGPLTERAQIDLVIR